MNKEEIVREVINKVREDKKLTDKEKDYLLCIGNDWFLLQQENQQLKKQKDDVVEYIKNNAEEYKWEDDDGAINKDYCCEGTVILRMLGEIDDN